MFENISKKIANVSRGAVNGTKKFAEGISLSSQVDECKKEINECYTKLGETFYTRTKTNIPEEYQGIFERIKMLNNQIILLEEQMRRVKGVRNCPKCNQEVSEDAIFCPSCGFSLPPMASPVFHPELPQKHCPNCGNTIDEDAAFCTECGYSFANQPQQEETATACQVEEDDEATVLLDNYQDEAHEGLQNHSAVEQITPEEVESIRVCKVCGAPLRPQSVFCTNCGARSEE